jgi:hypothetical protein
MAAVNVNVSKATIALAALVALTVLMALEKIDQAAGVGLLGLVVGYAVGNGIAAKTGTGSEPIIKPRAWQPGDPDRRDS